MRIGSSKLEEIVGEKVTPENTIFYICSWQGTVRWIHKLSSTKWLPNKRQQT